MLDPNNLDFKELGFHAGLEIHHQIKSKRKLFCNCPPLLIKNTTPPDYRFERYFRPVLGEMGDYDPGMLIEFEKGYRCIYHAFEACDCIYEQDEQPPFWPDDETIKNAYKLAHWFDMSALVDEIIFARKQYLDGSITTGFQRTSIVARDGYVIVDGKKIQITNLTVEEDAARRFKTENFGRTVYYNLDRLGVPLVEVITEHMDVEDPFTLLKLARTIGMILRMSGIGRRGIGAVRQDVNISIRGGDRVELKGVQDLRVMEKWCRNEVVRQHALIQIQTDLQNRSVKKDDFEHTYVDLSHLFSDIPKNFVVMGIRLPQFGDIFKREIQPGKDFGLDVMEKAVLISGVPLHYMFFSHELNPDSCRHFLEKKSKDEVQNFFFSQMNETIDHQIRTELQLQEQDAYYLAIHAQKWVIHAMKKVIERSKIAFDGVPQETRRATLDGNSEFLRVIHGKERLYPDTDTPVIDMDMEEIYALKDQVGEKPWNLEREFQDQYSMTFDNLDRLIRHDVLDDFRWLVKEKGINAKLAFNFFENTLIALRRKNLSIERLNKTVIYELLSNLTQNQYDAQHIPKICESYIKSSDRSINEVIQDFSKEAKTIKDIEQPYLAALERYNAEYGQIPKDGSKNGALEFKTNKITGFIMQQIHKHFPGQLVYQYVQDRLKKE